MNLQSDFDRKIGQAEAYPIFSFNHNYLDFYCNRNYLNYHHKIPLHLEGRIHLWENQALRRPRRDYPKCVWDPDAGRGRGADCQWIPEVGDVDGGRAQISDIILT